MKVVDRDQLMILGGLLIVAVSMSLIHGAKRANSNQDIESSKTLLPLLPPPPTPIETVQPMPSYKTTLNEISPTSLLASVRLLIESRSVELLVEQLHGISPKTTYAFLDAFIKDAHSMNADEVVQVAYGLLGTFAHDVNHRQEAFAIMDLINTAPELKDRPPLLVIAAYSSYPGIIPLILAWAKERKKLDLTIRDAIVFIANNFDEHLFKQLEKYGVAITPERATLMLWTAVQNPPNSRDATQDSTKLNARTRLIDALIQKGANLNYHQNGYTLLMKAAYNNDAVAVEQLIKAGAEINTILNPIVGSALQIAINNDTIDAELVLRRYHAIE